MESRGASLKAHKALPRRRVISEESTSTTQQKEITSPRKRRVSDSYKSEISSWIDSASPTISNPNQHLPLTPPPLPEDTPVASIDCSTIPEVLEDERLADNATPVGQMRPLTPDLTPPRVRKENHLAPLLHLRYPSSTSAADSFTTAREFATSVESLQRISSPESDLSTVIQTGQFHTGNTSLSGYPRDIGLGLTSDTQGLGGSNILPAKLKRSQLYQETVLNDPFIADETPAVQHVQAEKEQRQINLAEDVVRTDAIPERSASFSATKELSLLLKKRIVSDRLDSHRKSLKDALTEQEEEQLKELSKPLGIDPGQSIASSPTLDAPLIIEVQNEVTIEVAEDLGSPIEPSVTIVDVQTPVKAGRSDMSYRGSNDTISSDIRRLSRVSATSGNNIIEALVITPPRNRRHKLRRSSKNYCLRASSSPGRNSKGSPYDSSPKVQPLRHKSLALPEKPNRVSLNSDSGISMGYDAFHFKDNTIPLSEIPQRRSSLKRSLSKLPKLTTNGRSSNIRPVTAPERLISPSGEIMSQMHPIFDTRTHNLRRDSRSRSREVRHAPPMVIPARSSSLSAPTSQNNSRTGSMTSDAHKSIQPIQRSRSKRRSSSPHVRISLPDPKTSTKGIEGFIDPFCDDDASPVASPYLRSSLTRTPFSYKSTPGPVEYGEGTTISLYPHHNESVLMVQHTHRSDSQDGSTAWMGSETTRRSVALGRRQLEAQPSPAAALASEEMRRNISATSTSRSVNSPKKNGEVFNITRAPSFRRHSDSFIVPLSRLATASKTRQPRRRIKIEDASNTLSPFWRPNGFWNDLSDSEDELDSSDTTGSPDQHLVVRNTLGLPQQPAIVVGPAGLAKRLGSFRRRKQIQAQGQSHGRSSSMPSLDAGLPMFTNGHEAVSTKKQRPLSMTPITHIYHTITQKRAEKAEAHREKKRQQLKMSIGPAVLRESARLF